MTDEQFEKIQAEKQQQIRQAVEDAIARSNEETKLDKAVQKAISERSAGGKEITKKEAEKIYNQVNGREIKAERDAEKQARDAIKQENKFNRAWGDANASDLMQTWRSNKKNNYGREVGNASEFDDEGRVIPDSETENAKYITQSRKMGERDAAERKALRESQPGLDTSSYKDLSAASTQDLIDAQKKRGQLANNVAEVIFERNPQILRKYPMLKEIGGLVSQANRQLTDKELKDLINSSGLFKNLYGSENFTVQGGNLPSDYNWIRSGEEGTYLTPNELLAELTAKGTTGKVNTTGLKELMEKKLGPSVFIDKYPMTAEDVFKVLAELQPSVKKQLLSGQIPESQQKLDQAVAGKMNAAKTMSSPKDAFGSYYGYLKDTKGDVYDMLTKAADLYGRSNNILDNEGNFSLPKSRDKLFKEIQNAFKSKYNINNKQEHEQWKKALEQLNLHNEDNLSTMDQIHRGMEAGSDNFEGYGKFIKNFLQNYTTEGIPTPLIPKEYTSSENAQAADEEQIGKMLEQISQQDSGQREKEFAKEDARLAEMETKLAKMPEAQRNAILRYWDAMRANAGAKDLVESEVHPSDLYTEGYNQVKRAAEPYLNDVTPILDPKPKKKVVVVKKKGGTTSDERVKNIIGGICNGIFD